MSSDTGDRKPRDQRRARCDRRVPGTPPAVRIGRRAFLQGGVLLLGSAALQPGSAAEAFAQDDGPPTVRAGLLTDLHHADKPRRGTRYYRETITKLAEAASRFREEPLDFVVELGDLIDAADSVETELGYLERINADYSTISEKRHYVLGNHCVDTLTKQEFLEGVGREESYYSFDEGGFHFVVVDSCFNSEGAPYGRRNFTWTDANVPQAELDWLREDLAGTERPTIVFAHQRLDETRQHSARNAGDVRTILEASGRVLAVFQGHSHQNDYQEINGVHYVTLRAMVEDSGPENNGYSVLSLTEPGTIRVTGFRRQQNYEWPGWGHERRAR